MLVAVCCQGADALALFDADTGEERGTVPVGSDPVHAIVVEDRVLVATMGDRAVSVVDTDGSVRTVRTGVLGPSHFAVSDDHVFVPCTAGDIVAVLDRDATVVTDRLSVGAEPHDVDVVGDLGVVGSRRDGTVSVFDAVDATVRGRLTLDSDDPRVQGVTAVRDDETTIVYAVDQRNATVVRFDVDPSSDSLPRAPTATAPVGDDPYELSILDGRLYVPGRADGTIHELSRDLETIAIHDVGGRPIDVLGSRHWIVDGATARFHTLEGSEIKTVGPAIAAVPIGEGQYVLSHYDDDALSLVDVLAEEVVWSRSTPERPFGAIGV